jgi:hypothetical protein
MKVIVEVPIDCDGPQSILGRIANRLGISRHTAKRAAAKAVRTGVWGAIQDYQFYLLEGIDEKSPEYGKRVIAFDDGVLVSRVKAHPTRYKVTELGR